MSPRDAHPLITVIVPAYNAAETVGRTLDSLAVQTFQDFEVVVVDDASGDPTCDVVEDYADRVPGLRLIRRESNSGGVGAPRNDGIRAARGTYVMFLDSDDEIPATACELLLAGAERTGADITAGRAERVNLGRGTMTTWQPALYTSDRHVASVTEWPELLNDPIAAAKLYRREFLVDNEVFFPEGVFYEDTYFSVKSYHRARGISVLAEPVYHWIWEDKATDTGDAASITNRRGEIRSISDRVRVHRMADAYLLENDARELKLYKDAKFISHDVRLYMKELRQADETYLAEFGRLVSGYLGGIDEEAYGLCAPLDRVRAFYLRHTMIPEALTVADFEQRRGVVSTDLHTEGGRVYWSGSHLSLPGARTFLDVTELGLENERFESSRMFNQAVSLDLTGRTLAFSGEIVNQFGRVAAGDKLELVLFSRSKELGKKTIGRVADVRVTPSTIGYTASLTLDELVGEFPAEGTVNVMCQLVWKDRKHTTAVCVRGRDLGALNRTLSENGFEAYTTASGNLALRRFTGLDGAGFARLRVHEADWGWWRERPAPAAAVAPQSPSVTVVVPAGEEPEALRACLSSVVLQDEFPRAQVLVVGTGAGAVADVVAAHGNVSVVDGAAGSSAETVLEQATAPYVIFLDGSGVLAEGALGRLVAVAARHSADVVLGDLDRGPRAEDTAPEVAWKQYFGTGQEVFEGAAAAPELVFATDLANKLFSAGTLRGLTADLGPDGRSDRVRLGVSALLRAERIALVDAHVYGTAAAVSGDEAAPVIRDRLSEARQLLTLCTSLLSDPLPADAGSRALLQRFVAGSFEACMTTLPKMLNRAGLAEIYADVRALYKDIPDDVILDYAVTERSRLLHHAVKSGSLSVFCAPGDAPVYVPRLFITGEAVHRRLEGDIEPSTILQVEGRAALLESIRPVDGDLQVEGLLQLSGVDLTPLLENELTLDLETASHRVSVPVVQVYRRDRWHARKRQDLHGGWRAVLTPADLSALKGGSYSLTLRVHDGDASVGIPLTARPVAHRTKGTERIGRFRYEVGIGADNTPSLKVARAGSVRRIGHSLNRLWSETADVLARRPGWLLRLLYWISRPVLGRRDIWVVGERHDTAQDNGYHFFRYMRENHARRNVYYVIDAKAADRAKVAPFGNVVARGTLRHRLYLLNATRLISPYDLEAYLAPPNISKPEFLRRFGDLLHYRRVFLQHGVTYNDVSQSAHRQFTNVDLFVAVAESEADYISREMGYGKDEVVALGFPRFDKLEPAEADRLTILLMPTWRRDIVVPSYNRSRRPTVQFAASEYFRFYSRLLADERLRGALERSGVRLEFYPHYEIRPYLRHFQVDHPSIEVADQTKRGVQEAMRECSLLVTDYSSVFFDVAYMGKPVVYVPYDEEEFYTQHYRRGYYNLTEDGFGPVCHTVDDAVDEIIAAIDGRFEVSSPYRERVNSFFVHRDRDNCARVYDAVNRLGAKAGRS
ncbi:glycosyltransferase [Streptomyces sp. NPDC059718]